MITVIRGITLIDGTGADPLHNEALAFSQECILEVGRASQVSVPREAHVIEADGLFLLPGLIDTHVHLVYSGLNVLQEITTPPSLSLLRVVPHAKATLDAGVTTARDAGGTPAGVKLAIERGFFPGPRLQVAISLLSQTGGHADSHLPCGVQIPLPSSDIPHTVVDGCDEVRKAARQILQAGADWIKLCATGGVLSKDDHPSQCQFTVEELTTAVYEATAHGKRVMAHAQATQGIKNAIRAGVTSVEHGVWLDDEAIELMVRNDVWLVPTLVASREVIERAEKVPGSMPEWAVTKAGNH
jgi:imidazolonepropionase-like amidohydrolase